MGYHSFQKKVIDTNANKEIAVATFEVGAEIIAKALNHYFGDTFTRNESVEMMHKNTANGLEKIANFLEKYEYTGNMAVEYLRELSEEIKAQALVVSLRDELRFDEPKQGQ